MPFDTDTMVWLGVLAFAVTLIGFMFWRT